MNPRPLHILFMFSLLCAAASASANTIHFDPYWIMETKDGRKVEVASITADEDQDGRFIFIYTTTSGEEGFTEGGNIANDDELLAILDRLKEGKDSVYFEAEGQQDNSKYPIANKPAAESENKRKAATDQATSVIVKNCKDKWVTDYRMIDYCIKKQREAHANVSRMSGNILQYCRERWGDDYRMVEYCFNKQTEAKRRVDQY